MIHNLPKGSRFRPKTRSTVRTYQDMCPQKISAQSDEAFPKYAVYRSDFLNIVIHRTSAEYSWKIEASLFFKTVSTILHATPIPLLLDYPSSSWTEWPKIRALRTKLPLRKHFLHMSIFIGCQSTNRGFYANCGQIRSIQTKLHVEDHSRKLDFHWLLASQWDSEKFESRFELSA